MLNAAASQAAKQSGMQLALDMSGDWKTEVLLELRGWLAVHQARGFTTMTFEQFRADAKRQPPSPKAWGSLPGIACRAGLIAPKTHPDGSPVMRNAESVKTRAHPVRVWAIVSASSSTEGDKSPMMTFAEGSVARRQPIWIEPVGEGRLSHSAMDACAEYHRDRAGMDQAMGAEGA